MILLHQYTHSHPHTPIHNKSPWIACDSDRWSGRSWKLGRGGSSWRWDAIEHPWDVYTAVRVWRSGRAS
jgi:hypothetical protein